MLYAELSERDEPLTVEESETVGARATSIISATREKLRMMVWEKKIRAILRDDVEVRTNRHEEGASSVEDMCRNALEGLSRLDIIKSVEERIGLEQGSSIVLEKEERRQRLTLD